MTQSNLSTKLADALEQGIGSSIDLWPAIQTQVRASKAPPRRVSRIAWASGIALIALLGIASVTVVLSLTERAAAVDAGIDAVYRAGLTTSINQSQTVGNVTVTLEWVYADPLRVLVAYSTDAGRQEDFRPGTYVESLSLTNGTQLQQIGGVGYVDTHTQMADISQLLMPDLPPGTDMLDGQLALRVNDESVLLSTDDSSELKMYRPEALSTLYFDVHIPITSARILLPEQQVSAANRTMRLERLSVAPSGVRADICFDIPSADTYDWQLVGEAQGGGKSIDYAATSLVDDDPTCRAVVFLEPLPLDASSYIVRITEIVGLPTERPEDDIIRIAGPWVFDVSAD